MTSHVRRSYASCVRSFPLAASAIAGLIAIGAAASWPTLHAAGQSPSPSPLTALTRGFTLDGPFTQDNLTIYVVRGSTTDARQYITLDQGLAEKTVAVREMGAQAGRDQAQVNTLEIENRSDKWLFLQAGDIVKGGKQDRTIMTDLTLAPHSGPQPIEAFCVEHGRWTPSGNGLAFGANPGIVAGAPLKMAIQSEKSQPRVWQEVAKAEGQAAAVARANGAALSSDLLSSTGTYNAIAEQKTLSDARVRYVAALLPRVRAHTNAIGLVVAINGVVTSADVYASPSLFQQLSGKLVDSYALEATMARSAAGRSAAPTRAQADAFLAKPASARAASEKVGQSMQRSTRETDESVMYEYGRVEQPAGAKTTIAVVHQSYLKKSR